MNLKKYICGNEMEKMPDIAFISMSIAYKIGGFFYDREKRIEKFGIKKGDIVIDYGCGPARYVKRASQLVKEEGKVYAIDIHELAIKFVKDKIKKYSLKNVKPILAKGYTCNIKSRTADIIYALDMFHMIREPNLFLRELHRLLKHKGFLIIDNGHQSRKETKKKINNSKLWEIVEEGRNYLKCKPLQKFKKK